MIKPGDIKFIQTLGYILDTAEPGSLANHLNRNFPGLELKKLITDFERLLAEHATPPEIKEIKQDYLTLKIMLTDNKNFREAGHIAEELLDNEAYELERRCVSVERTVKGGAFLLDKALKLYDVDMDSYVDYIAKTHADDMSAELSEASENARMIHKTKVMITKMFENVDRRETVSLINNLESFSTRVEKGEVVYK